MEYEHSFQSLEAITSAENNTIAVKMSKKKILKNLVIIGLSFHFLFLAFSSMAVLQSTINKDGGLGTSGLAILYGSLIISSMFFPSFVISHLGCKWTIALSMICYIVYMGANMYATPYTMYPASVIIGLGAAPLWAAKSAYLTKIAVEYAEITGKTKDASINYFFGVFFMVFHTSAIWGNIISSTVLKLRTLNISDEQLVTCGPNFCPSSPINNTNLEKPSDRKIHILVGCYFVSASIAFLLVVFFLDKIKVKRVSTDDNRDNNKPSSTDNNRDNNKPSLHLLTETFRHCWKSKPQKLLIPLTVYIGIEEALFGGDFSEAYIACSAGVWNIGYVVICFAVTASVCSFTSGKLVEYIGHVAFFVIGAVTNVTLLITLYFWVPTPSTFYVLFVVAAMWGIGDAIWQTQMGAFYGQLFTSNPEAAFSNFRLWESVGSTVAFAYSSYLCTVVKLYICMGTLTVGMAGYGMVEILQRSVRPVEEEKRDILPDGAVMSRYGVN